MIEKIYSKIKEKDQIRVGQSGNNNIDMDPI